MVEDGAGEASQLWDNCALSLDNRLVGVEVSSVPRWEFPGQNSQDGATGAAVAE